jgi:hypothetical protein
MQFSLHVWRADATPVHSLRTARPGPTGWLLAAGEEQGMLALQGHPPDPESIRMILLLIAAAAVIFWRVVLKLLVIAAIFMAVLGALTMVQGLH